ncbi:hypothetical protein SUGI_0428530 [Cryptomeria japonica]|uniref:low affinity inorganic phosphate transporter 3-like n=1 Tax=Cryptomeria japonica TaxID=3369 RepID=UPI002408C112|nr:low affinity inorganic phosphate transporter 3-like [Cryptomeria japonica]GLJ22749.1 hypothetical protein SUGI_0428530 [Cryptomeria japonica]
MELKVLSHLDVARIQLYHFRAIIVAGMGFLTDAYNVFCIPPISNLLEKLYYGGNMSLATSTAVNGIALCGILVGNIFFGRLGDRMGRKNVYEITLILIMGGSFGSGFSLGKSPRLVVATLCFFRFWLGVGIGGDYPLSATIIAEYANTKSRGAFMSAVFAMYSVGMLAASGVAMVVSARFKGLYPNQSLGEKDILWRILLMLGAVPAVVTFYWRMKVPETARFTALVARDVDKAAADMSKVLAISINDDEADVIRIRSSRPSFRLFSKAFMKLHGKHLVGTMSSWFFLDLAFYGSNLYQKELYSFVGWLKKPEEYENPVDEVFHIARAQVLITLCGTLPGCLANVFLIDRFGRFKIQLFGFLLVSVWITAIALPLDTYWQDPSNKIGFLAIYSLACFFLTFGPTSTTFIVPEELFPARLRSTCHGLSAAAGKVGGLIGTFGFVFASTKLGPKKTLLLLAVGSFLGFLCTFLIPETMGRSLEENEREIGLSESDSSHGYSIHTTADTSDSSRIYGSGNLKLQRTHDSSGDPIANSSEMLHSPQNRVHY